MNLTESEKNRIRGLHGTDVNEDHFGFRGSWMKDEEEVNLDKHKASFSTKEFTDWVDSEFDVEVLEMTKMKIDDRISFLNNLIAQATRKTIKGFGGE